MNNNKNQSMITLAIMIMFLVLLVIYMTMLQPANKELSNKNKQVEQLRNQSDLLTKALSRKIEKGKLPETEVQAALPLWDNTEQMVVSIKEIGQMTGTKLSSVSFSVSDSNQINTIIGGQEPMYPTVKELKVQAVIQGSYDQIRSWIVQIQKLPRLVNVDTVRYSLPVTGTTAAEISITGYFDPSYEYMLENPIIPTAKQ